MAIHILELGNFNSRPFRAVKKYCKSTLYFWRVSRNNSLNRFIIQHINLALGIVIFYFLLPWKVEIFLMDQISHIYFSLPSILQDYLSKVDSFFSSVQWISLRLIFSTIIAGLVNLLCPTTPRNVFRSSLRGAYIQLFLYLGVILFVLYKEIARLIWYYLQPSYLNEPTKA